MKKIIFVFLMFFLSFNFISLFSSLRSYLQVNFLTNRVLTEQIYKLIDCYLSNYNLEQESMFEQLQELDNAFKTEFVFSTTYSFLQKNSPKIIKLLIFWGLHLNMSECEHKNCREFSQDNNSFKNLYDLCLEDMAMSEEYALKICFFIILQNKFYDLFSKHSVHLNEDVATMLLEELKSLSSAFINDKGYMEAYEFLRIHVRGDGYRCRML